MIVAVKINKCNITSLAIEQLNKLYWGYVCKYNSSIEYENYIQYLNCPTVKPNICHPDNCSNPTIINVCNLALTSISYIAADTVLTFYIDPINLSGATPPISYLWTYDINDFDLISLNNTGDIIVLKLKADKILSEVVSFVEVHIIDVNGCSIDKLCALVEGEVICTDGYVPCPNVNNLTVSNSSLPFFNIIATGLNSITNSFTIISGGDFIVDWGDGDVASYLAGTRTPTHVYDTPYTGYIRVSTSDLDNITDLTLGTSLGGISPSTNALTILTSEINKLTSLDFLSLGDQVFLDGIVANLPSTLIILAAANTNLSGTTLQLPRGLIVCSIQGTNTISGIAGNLPPDLETLILRGFNTISGDVLTLPRGIISALSIQGSNTLSGSVINLPPDLIQVEILGFNTITGDVAGFPASLITITIIGNNVLFGNLANFPALIHTITIGGLNIISGTLSGIPSIASIFQIGGHNTISGDVALVPTSITIFDVTSTTSTINAYTSGVKTWAASMKTIKVIPGINGLSSTDVDNMLIEIAAQVTSWTGGTKVLSILGASDARTVASDAAVLIIESFGVTVNTTP